MPDRRTLVAAALSALTLPPGALRAARAQAAAPAPEPPPELAAELPAARLHPVVGAQIAERSLIEMRRQGEIAADTGARWFAAMKALFPDVDAGHRLTGVHRPGEGVRFFHNGRLLGEVRDAEFARLFFGIWLARQTSEPTLRAALLGR